MTHQVPRRRIASTGLTLISGLVLLLAGLGTFALLHQGKTAQADSRPVPIGSSPTPPAATTDAGLPPSAPALDRTSRPVQVSVPSVGIDSSLQPLGLLSNGTLQPPSQWQQAGWYAKGTVPGSVGPAVIAGHVDSTAGPAVFFRLREIKPGASIFIRRQDGRTLTFVVDAIHSYPKDRFPSAAVYGPTADPQLRLITCTGDFDYRQRSYLDNLVVSAHLA